LSFGSIIKEYISLKSWIDNTNLVLLRLELLFQNIKLKYGDSLSAIKTSLGFCGGRIDDLNGTDSFTLER
jgi:hypothetical protein